MLSRTLETLTFKDKTRAFDGIQAIAVNINQPPRADKIIVKGKGENLSFTPPPWSGSVTVEMTAMESGVCAQATYSTPTKNVAGQYKAKSD